METLKQSIAAAKYKLTHFLNSAPPSRPTSPIHNAPVHQESKMVSMQPEMAIPNASHTFGHMLHCMSHENEMTVEHSHNSKTHFCGESAAIDANPMQAGSIPQNHNGFMHGNNSVSHNVYSNFQQEPRPFHNDRIGIHIYCNQPPTLPQTREVSAPTYPPQQAACSYPSQHCNCAQIQLGLQSASAESWCSVRPMPSYVCNCPDCDSAPTVSFNDKKGYQSNANFDQVSLDHDQDTGAMAARKLAVHSEGHNNSDYNPTSEFGVTNKKGGPISNPNVNNNGCVAMQLNNTVDSGVGITAELQSNISLSAENDSHMSTNNPRDQNNLRSASSLRGKNSPSLSKAFHDNLKVTAEDIYGGKVSPRLSDVRQFSRHLPSAQKFQEPLDMSRPTSGSSLSSSTTFTSRIHDASVRSKDIPIKSAVNGKCKRKSRKVESEMSSVPGLRRSFRFQGFRRSRIHSSDSQHSEPGDHGTARNASLDSNAASGGNGHLQKLAFFPHLMMHYDNPGHNAPDMIFPSTSMQYDAPTTELEESIITSYNLERDSDTYSYISSCLSVASNSRFVSNGKLGGSRSVSANASLVSVREAACQITEHSDHMTHLSPQHVTQLDAEHMTGSGPDHVTSTPNESGATILTSSPTSPAGMTGSDVRPRRRISKETFEMEKLSQSQVDQNADITAVINEEADMGTFV